MNIKNIYIYFKYKNFFNINVFAVTFDKFNVSLLNQKALESFTFVPKTFEKYTALCGLKDTVNHSVSPSATPFQIMVWIDMWVHNDRFHFGENYPFNNPI